LLDIPKAAAEYGEESTLCLETLLEQKRFQLIIKRIFDVAASSVGLIILSPFFILIAIAIILDSGGPIFFKQTRVGKNEAPFEIYKFRTMVSDAESRGMQLTVGQDPRITRVGAFLRKTKLDEFPQLFNVLKGDMSLVGPRPEVPKYVQMYTDEQK
jgi:lipopolysaccharide/colanic/teichoic acid biosynthesis glycosyltransferase